MDLYPCPITVATQGILRNVGLLEYHEEATSLKGHFRLLAQLIRRGDFHRQAFDVGPDMWFQPNDEEIYFITSLSMRGGYYPQLPDVLHGVATESHLVYSQRYVGDHVVSPIDFQVFGGQHRSLLLVQRRLGASHY